MYHYSFSDSSVSSVLNSQFWDERDASFSNKTLIHSDDRSGVYNLRINDDHYVTNVLGGAFMADINEQGDIVYSLYENGKYMIALLINPQPMNDANVGYKSDHYLINAEHDDPIIEQINTDAHTYSDDFTTMFILPRVMMDYETIKPGFYFFSNEVLERLNVFGGATINSVMDVDLFFIFEFKRFYPTLFAEVFYLTRNIQQTNFYSSYQLDDNLKFRLTQFSVGMRLPLFGVTQIELFSTWQVYRAFIEETIPTENLQAGIAYDYYKGWLNGIKWNLDNVKRLTDADINPSKGFKVNFSAIHEQNDFIIDNFFKFIQSPMHFKLYCGRKIIKEKAIKPPLNSTRV